MSISIGESVIAFDYNHDGLQDLCISPSFNTSDPDLPIRIFLNKGNFHFQEETQKVFFGAIPVTGYVNHPVISADFNNDGFNDLFLVDHGQEIAWPWDGGRNKILLSTVDGQYYDASINNLPDMETFNHHGSYGDIDNDGDLDILVSNLHLPNSYLLINDGSGKFSINTQKLPQNMVNNWDQVESWANPGGSILADVNGDEKLDIVFGSYKGALPRRISVALQSDDGNFVETQDIDFHANFSGMSVVTESGYLVGDTGVSEIVTADFDNDGDQDFLVHLEGSQTGKNGLMSLRNDSGTLVDNTNEWFPMGNLWQDILPSRGVSLDIKTIGFELRDFNNDGRIDFSVANYSLQLENPGSYIFINTGDGFIQAAYANGVNNDTGWDFPGIAPAFADFDNDGDIDIVGFRSLSSTTFTIDVLQNGLVQTLLDANDQVSGTDYRDIIHGGGGSDLIEANGGADLVRGQAGADTLSGGAGDDLIYGNKDTDRLVGGGGADTLFGGQQSDTVFGLLGADQVYGNKQNDTLHGGLDDDSLFGGQQDDLLYGQFGNDRIDGNRGNDTLYGEDGIDTFVISKGDDWVMDFNTAQDKIETADAYSAITQSVSSGNLVLSDSDGDTLTLLGVTSTLSEGYFV